MPAAHEYMNAIHNLSACFLDSDIATGEYVPNSRGQPLSSAGARAIVFSVRNARVGGRWAVRCFTSRAEDQPQRYAAISRYLDRHRPQGFIDFRYLDAEVLVRTGREPVLKMEWVEGQDLLDATRAQLHSPESPRRMAEQWRTLAAALRAQGIAHGDLQQGNILMRDNGELTLVDYDGMFVPELRGLTPVEWGLTHFQHPQRKNSTFFDERLDYFSSIVIYVSLLALAEDATLLDSYNNGNNLIFTGEDFARPDRSRLFGQLKASREATLRELTAQLERLCGSDYRQIPCLEEFLQAVGRAPGAMPPIKVRICRHSCKRAGVYCQDADVAEQWFESQSGPTESCDVCRRETVTVWICRESGRLRRPGCLDAERREFTRGAQPIELCDTCYTMPSSRLLLIALLVLMALLAGMTWMLVRQAGAHTHRAGDAVSVPYFPENRAVSGYSMRMVFWKKENVMSHQQIIDRKHQGCIVFLVDQSGSMQETISGSKRQKSEEVADVVNRILQEFVLKAVKGEEIREYYDIAAIGYGNSVASCFGGPLAERKLIPIKDIVENPLRVETRRVKINDGRGRLIEVEEEFPIWIEPKACGPTPMREALAEAAGLLREWIPQHNDSFPPLVINITDGEPTMYTREGNLVIDDAERVAAAAALVTEQYTQDGNTLLFNCHITDRSGASLTFPHALNGSEDKYARLLFNTSSPLPDKMRAFAAKEGLAVTEGARGFVYNARFEQMVQLLDTGTQVVQTLTEAR